jgi:hypothetical protein
MASNSLDDLLEILRDHDVQCNRDTLESAFEDPAS